MAEYMTDNQKTEREREISLLAGEVLDLAHDRLLMHLRFFDMALARIRRRERLGLGGMAWDGSVCFYDPVFVLQRYREDPGYVARVYLHMLLHCIFFHNYQCDKLDRELWDLAVDIAVENVILQMNLDGTLLEKDGEAERILQILQEDAGSLTAEKIYRYFKKNPPSETEKSRLQGMFFKDLHVYWGPAEQLEIGMDQWKKISERVKADLKSFTRGKKGLDSLEKNLGEATRDRYDYTDILRRFTARGEDISVNDDEFDYIYYHYGMEHYGNMPLIEPLEYKEVNKVKEFVIAIDTSASCRGAIVRAFLRKTYSILKSSENFFQRINVHIIQCDNEIQSDTRITCDEDFEVFIKEGKLKGFGATDFRPVFDYVDDLVKNGEFENLKGMIYFTDGYGIYPTKRPEYSCIFAFLDEDENRAPVPPWSMKVVLESDELEEETGDAGQ